MPKANPLFVCDWFPYYFERFEGSDKVAAMSLTEEGAYHRAIRLAWKYGTVPADPELLAAKIQKRCTPKIAAVVLTTFEVSPNDPKRMFHPIVEEIRNEQKQKHLTKVRGGKASAKARKRTKQKTSSTTQTEVSPAPTQAAQNQNKNQIQTQNKEDFKRLIETCARENSNVDKRLVEIGVLYTMLQRNGSTEPIQSAKYFNPEIAKVAKDSKRLGTKAIDALLSQRRKQYWEKQEGH
jgi:hypothetical protein